ncbi:MAG: hypothetical protein EBR82_84070, partial [Caulobacteraceae bacterium]|nr:hypothetical protein [Caulobacteraceae bacterium]
MRLTSTGLGIGTSLPLAKLHVKGATNGNLLVRGGASAASGLTGTALSSINDAASATVSLTFEGSDFYFVENNAVVATLNSSGNSSGNLGLGVTPSAWAGDKAVQLPWGSISSGYQYSVNVSSVAYRDNATWRYQTTGQAPAWYEQEGSAHRWYTAPSGTAGNAIAWVQAMTLDASGNLGIGTTSPANLLHVNGSNSIARFSGASTSLSAYQTFFNNSAAQAYFGIESSTGTGIIGSGAAYGMVLATASTNPLVFGTNNAERARIDSSGNLLVGTTSTNGRLRVVSTASQSQGLYVTHPTAAQDVISCENSDTSGNNVFIQFYTDATVNRGAISYNRTSGLVVYGTSSDYRAKDINGPMTDSGTLIDSVPVYIGTMKGATQKRPMF